MEFVIETIFKIIIMVVVSAIIIYLTNYYYQKAKIDIPTDEKGELQIFLIKSNEDMAKAIYGCYSYGNFGKLKQKVDCYIVKIQTNNLNDDEIRKILFENFTVGDIYEKISFGNLVENTTILVFYYNGYVRFKII